MGSFAAHTIGSGDVFSKGSDFAAWFGLVPKHISTGDRTILGKISKRGNRYLRVLFVQAAWVGLVKPMSGAAATLPIVAASAVSLTPCEYLTSIGPVNSVAPSHGPRSIIATFTFTCPKQTARLSNPH